MPSSIRPFALGLVAGVLLAGAGAMVAGQGPGKGAGTTKLAGAPGHPAPERGAVIGRITAIDPRSGEIRIGFGRRDGAEVGMRLRLLRIVREAGRPEVAHEESAGFVVTAVDERGCTARREAKERFEEFGFGPDRTPVAEVKVGDEIRYATDTETFLLTKLATGDEPDAVRRLAVARAEIARRAFEFARWSYAHGMIPCATYVRLARSKMESDRDAAKGRDGRLAALRTYLDRMTDCVEEEADRALRGAEVALDFAEARDAHAEAALLLAKARHAPDVEGVRPKPRAPSKSLPRATSRPGPYKATIVGQVLRFDAPHGEARSDFGSDAGARVGMKLVGSHNPIPGQPAPDPRPMALEIVSVAPLSSVLRFVPRAGDPAHPLPTPAQGDILLYTADDEIRRISRLGREGDPDSVGELARMLAEDAAVRVKFGVPLVQVGSLDLLGYADLSRFAMEAAREAASTRTAELAALRTHLDRLDIMIEDDSGNFAVEHDSEPYLTFARLAQAAAALRLAEARRGPGKP
jgi:hypothetical protein